MRVLVIIPCYNEEDSIERVVRELMEVAPFADYLVVNDCSTDRSEDILRKNNFNYINNPVNLGIGGGVQAGYQYAFDKGYDIAVQMDGDGQHDPNYLSQVCRPVRRGEADMTIGSRFIDKEGFQSSFLRRFGIKILSVLIFVLTGKKVRDVTSGYRACNRDLIEYFSRHYADDFPEPEAIVSCVCAGHTVREVPVVMRDREQGISSIRSVKSAYYMVKVCLALVVRRISFSRKDR